MSFSVSDQAKLYYSNYTLSKTQAYRNYSGDASKINNERFNVVNVSDAMDELDDFSATDFSTIGNLDSYVKTSYELTASSSYEKIKPATEESTIADLVSGSTDLSSVYEDLSSTGSAQNLLIETQIDKKTSAGMVGAYSKYLKNNSVGSLIDIFE